MEPPNNGHIGGRDLRTEIETAGGVVDQLLPSGTYIVESQVDLSSLEGYFVQFYGHFGVPICPYLRGCKCVSCIVNSQSGAHDSSVI